MLNQVCVLCNLSVYTVIIIMLMPSSLMRHFQIGARILQSIIIIKEVGLELKNFFFLNFLVIQNI